MSSIVIPEAGFKEFIINLAREHKVKFVSTELTRLADKISELSDSDVVLDDIENLVVALRKAGVITGHEMGLLIQGYYYEKKGQ